MTLRQHRASLSLSVVQLFTGTLIAILLGFLFREMTHDYMQHDSDAAYFFETSSAGNISLPLDESILTTENTVPLMLWSLIYEAISKLSIRPTPIWGILLNATLVFTSQLLTLLFARKVFDLGEWQLNRLASLLSFNGILMMFAGIHMRDAFLLLITTVSMIAFFPRYSLTFNNNLQRLIHLLLLMVVAFLCRKEGFAVPLVIYAISMAMELKRHSTIGKVVVLGLLSSLIGLAISIEVLDIAKDNYSAYLTLSEEENKEGISYYLLYELPFPFSAILSAVQLLFIKFPFWRGWLFDSYSFFISIAAMQMLFVAPVFIALVAYSIFNKVRSEISYLLITQLSLLFLTALTSNQVRHFSVGYTFLLLLFQMRKRILGLNSPYTMFQYIIFGAAIILNIFAGFR